VSAAGAAAAKAAHTTKIAALRRILKR